jgi:hypothetical protein
MLLVCMSMVLEEVKRVVSTHVSTRSLSRKMGHGMRRRQVLLFSGSRKPSARGQVRLSTSQERNALRTE